MSMPTTLMPSHGNFEMKGALVESLITLSSHRARQGAGRETDDGLPEKPGNPLASFRTEHNGRLPIGD